MRKRRIYVLVVVLGLTMVWLGFLYTYELKIVEQKAPFLKEVALVKQQHLLDKSPVASATDLARAKDPAAASSGFPLVLAGIGMIFTLGGAFSYRERTP